jgi:antitoxin (DNA-binding transcriptional repressor) of toxin-antitoxin stability system
MAAGEFKAKCLAVMAEVNATGRPVLITKRGKPMARLTEPGEVPVRKVNVDSIFNSLRDMITVSGDAGDLVEPVFPVEDWDHLKDDWSSFPPE